MDGPFWLSCSLPPQPWVCAKQTERAISPLQPPVAAPPGRGITLPPPPHPPWRQFFYGREKLEKYVGIVLNPSFAMRLDPLGHPHPLHAVGTAISPRKTALTLTRSEHTHSAQHSTFILAVIQTATCALKTVTAILSSTEQN